MTRFMVSYLLVVLGSISWIGETIGNPYTESCDITKHTELGLSSGVIPDANLMASSSSSNSHRAARGRLNQEASGRQASSWCARYKDKEQWLAVDLVYTSKITHIATQGQFDPRTLSVSGPYEENWVTEYTIQYSPDNKTYNQYDYKGDRPLVFKGNSNGNGTECRVLPYPITVRYLRIHPISWHGRICMRIGVFGISNVTAIFTVDTSNQVPHHTHIWWWLFFWTLLAFILLAVFFVIILYYCHIRKRMWPREKIIKVKPTPLPVRKRDPEAAYANEAYDMTIITSRSTTTVVMPEEGEEIEEDEVQEVTADFTADEVENRRGIIGFSLADEDEETQANDDIDVPNGNATRDRHHTYENVDRDNNAQ